MNHQHSDSPKDTRLFGMCNFLWALMGSEKHILTHFFFFCVVDETRASVSNYYGKELLSSKDLKTNACKGGSPPKYIRDAIHKISPDVVSKYYGCGLCLPQYPLEGAKILDLGCGAGLDVYIASQLVGPTGHVVGVDMTEELLAVAKKHQAYHAERFGFSNVEFHQSYLEELADINLEPESFDVIISNCVINLCTDKEAVLKECLNLLKPGGELYFSDVYSNRRVPKSLQTNAVLWGECLSGALYWYVHETENCRRRCSDPLRFVSDSIVICTSVATQNFIQYSGTTFKTWRARLDFLILVL